MVYYLARACEYMEISPDKAKSHFYNSRVEWNRIPGLEKSNTLVMFVDIKSRSARGLAFGEPRF